MSEGAPKPKIKSKLGGEPDPRWERVRRGLPVEFDSEPTHNDLLREKRAEGNTPKVEPKPRSRRTALKITTPPVQETESDPTKYVPTIGEYINHRKD